MTTAPTIAPARAPHAERWLTHLACPYSSEDVAICGYRGSPVDPKVPVYCVVCIDLSTLPCPSCGHVHSVD